MIMKKAQAQIITTVLIILLVLAAIVIVWQVVNTTVTGGAEQVRTQGACLGATLEITNIAATSVTVRNTGAEDVDGVKIYVEGSLVGTSIATLGSGETYTTNSLTIDDGDEVTASAVIGTATCPAFASEIADI